MAKRLSNNKILRSKQSALDAKLAELGKNKNTKMYSGMGTGEEGGGIPGMKRMSTKQVWQSRKLDRKGDKDLKDWHQHAN